MDQITVKNICAGMIHEAEQSRQAIGCPTAIGCFKGKEHDNYIKGALQSKLNDLREARDRQDKINDETHKKFEVVIKMATNAVECTSKASKAAEDAQEAATSAKNAINKIWIAILLPVVGSTVIWFASQIYYMGPKQDKLIQIMSAKLDQDAKNQVETVQYLKALETRLQPGGNR